MSHISLIAFQLSQFYGLYMVILAFVMFNRVHIYRQLIKNLNPESGTILLGALVGIAFGLILVGVNNVWTLTPVILVTILSWIILVGSVLWLSMPEYMVALHKRVFLGKGYYIFTAIIGISGLVFLARGVYIYATQHSDFAILGYFFK